jgi:hypothetical protein
VIPRNDIAATIPESIFFIVPPSLQGGKTVTRQEDARRAGAAPEHPQEGCVRAKKKRGRGI